MRAEHRIFGTESNKWLKGLIQPQILFILFKQETGHTEVQHNCKLNTARLKLCTETMARKLHLGLKFPCT